jgi:hypothetical protein
MNTLDRRGLFLVACLTLAPLVGGCWKHSEITAQKEDRSFLKLQGDLAGVSLRLDGGEPIALLDEDGEAAESGTLWEVLPGRHLVELVRGGRSILRRDLYVGPGQPLEVAVPR